MSTPPVPPPADAGAASGPPSTEASAPPTVETKLSELAAGTNAVDAASAAVLPSHKRPLPQTAYDSPAKRIQILPPQGAIPPGGALLESSPLGTGAIACAPLVSARTVKLKNIAAASENDVFSLLSPFTRKGPPRVLSCSSGEALVEVDDAVTASSVVNWFNAHTPHIRGVSVLAELGAGTPAYKVLHVTVTSLVCPVELEVLYFLFSKYGVVEKIVSFTKSPSRFQALVQMADPAMAEEAMMNLNGRSIYDGGNVMQIEPSVLSQLSVKSNNRRYWDYTVAPPPTTATAANNTDAGLPRVGVGRRNFSPMEPTSVPNFGAFGRSVPPPGADVPGVSFLGNPPFGNVPMGPAGPLRVGLEPGNGRGRYCGIPVEKLPRELQTAAFLESNPKGVCVICYNLPAREVNVQMIFNLFTLYGPVYRVKLLREKPDTALIQFGEPLFAALACHYLENAPMFGVGDITLQVAYSNVPEVKLPHQKTPESEEDAKRTASFGHSDQRYRSEEVDKYLRGACRPTCTLFVANVPVGTTENTLVDLFGAHGTVTKIDVKPPREGVRKSVTMLEMASAKEAVRALCYLHNHRIGDSLLKVAFSKQVLGADCLVVKKQDGS